MSRAARCSMCRAALPPGNVGALCGDDAACRVRRWKRDRRLHWLLIAALFIPAGLPTLLLAALCYSVVGASQRHRHRVASADAGDRIRADS